MSKVSRKLIVNNIWSIGKNESWFSDMALKGQHLKSINRFFAAFEKGEPTGTRYRTEVFYGKPSNELLDNYKERGWDFAAGIQNFYIFSSPESSNLPELHTDPVELGYKMEELDKRLKNKVTNFSIGLFFLLGIIISYIFLDSAPFLSMVEGPLFQMIMLALVELYVFSTVIRDYVAFHSLRKSLLEGKPVNHGENWKKSRIINGTAVIIFIGIAVFYIIIPLIGIAKIKIYTLPEAASGLPVIRLSNIEQDPGLRRSVSYDSRGVDWENSVRPGWGILAPVQYEVSEHGIVMGRMWKDNSGEYSPSIRIRYYQLVFPIMAKPLIEDLMDRYIYLPEDTPHKIESTKFNNLYIATDGIQKDIFASWENKVIHIVYFGDKGVEDIIATLAKLR